MNNPTRIFTQNRQFTYTQLQLSSRARTKKKHSLTNEFIWIIKNRIAITAFQDCIHKYIYSNRIRLIFFCSHCIFITRFHFVVSKSFISFPILIWIVNSEVNSRILIQFLRCYIHSLESSIKFIWELFDVIYNT